MNNNDEILTIQETCSLLKVGSKTVYKLLRNQQIPAVKVGREWRVLKSALMEYLNQKENVIDI